MAHYNLIYTFDILSHMTRFKSIHFDMDGVLADTEPFHVAAEQQTCKDFNFNIDTKQWDSFKGQTANAIFSHLLKNYGNPKKQTVAELINHKTNLFLDMARDQIKPINGALDFLQWARNNHEKITLVTSSNRQIQECIINSFGVAHLFDNIVTGDDIINGKPNPEPYLRSLKESCSQADSALVIEDSKSGIMSALASKCAVLAIATSYSSEELIDSEPTFIAIDFKDAKLQLE
ncbi:MAG: hypothetical protein PWQ10_420 [Patescibacteria group bacterium]|nr:hypothetical protein [Patescibacteria group bacterium]